MRNQQTASNPLVCWQCKSVFKSPVTITCGHTFCRNCIWEVVDKNPQCPRCQTIFLTDPQTLKENITISNILRIKYPDASQGRHTQPQPRPQNKVQDSPADSRNRYVKNRLLVSTKSKDLILPFVRRKVIIQLVNTNIHEELRGFVIEQKLSYTTNAVYGKIVSLQQHPRVFYEYECVFEGISFFEITNTKTIQTLDGEVTICAGNEIQDRTSLVVDDFTYFFRILDRLPHYYLNEIFQTISQSVVVDRNDPTALLYSAFGILRLDDKVKYKALTSFDDQKRLNVLVTALGRKPIDYVLKNPACLFKVTVPGGYSLPIVALILFSMLILYMVESKFTLEGET